MGKSYDHLKIRSSQKVKLCNSEKYPLWNVLQTRRFPWLFNDCAIVCMYGERFLLLITTPLEYIELLESVGHYFAWDMVGISIEKE